MQNQTIKKIVGWVLRCLRVSRKKNKAMQSQASKKRHREYMRWVRAERKAKGLTALGFQPVNRRHPDLAGLGGKTREYHTAYMRWQRENDRKNYDPL